MRDTTLIILVAYLKKHCGELIASHNVEEDLPRHGDLFHLVHHNGGTYSRKFRELRESAELQQRYDLRFQEVKDTKGKEKQWIILSNTPTTSTTQETLFVY
jgi:hypothetical protein